MPKRSYLFALFPFTLASLTLGLAACSGSDASPVAQGDEQDIIGGASPARPIRASLMPVVLLGSGCTATKVGPRHFLTAAHCVANPGNGEGMVLVPDPGAEWSVSSSPYDDEVRAPTANGQVTPRVGAIALVDHVTTDYNWMDACSIPGNSKGGRLCETTEFTKTAQKYEGTAPDLALVVFKDVAPLTAAQRKKDPYARDRSVRAMPSVPVYVGSLNAGTTMTLAGYGCAGPSATPSWLQTPEIHLGSAKVMNAPTHPGPIADDFGVLSKSYVFSDPTAMLCPGDSGGPALIKRGGQWAVAGVASGYTVVDGKVTANWHASVDGQAKFHPHRGGLGMVGSKPKETTVADWLVSEGVDVIH